ncbi:hypothetical protein AHAS_Ahas10G0057700 [Arachis hypogaea]
MQLDTHLSLVTSVKLYHLNLSGTLSPRICDLPRLIELNLSKNSLSGPISDGFANWHSLEILDLCTNRLHGEILTPIWNITKFRKLYLCENYMHELAKRFYSKGASKALEPYQLDSMAKLTVREIPPEIGNISNLQLLALHMNSFVGDVPKELGRKK